MRGASSSVPSKQELSLARLYNTIADGQYVFVDVLVAPNDTEDASLVDKALVTTANEVTRADSLFTHRLHRRLKDMYVCHSVCVFGERDDDVTTVVEWIASQHWPRDFTVYHLKNCTARDVCNCYSFLSTEHRKALEAAGAAAKASPPRLFSFLHDRAFEALPHRILDYLYLGDYSAAQNPALEKMGITAIVNASGDFQNSFDKNPNFAYLNIDVWDSPSADISQFFWKTIEFVDEHRKSQKKILIHCAAGVSRSTSLVLAYMMAREKMTLRDAFVHTKKIRKFVSPNSGFVAQLIAFEKNVHGQISVSVPERGIWLSLPELIRRDIEMSGSGVSPDMKGVLDQSDW